jgi:hypothetical protein
LGRVNIRLRPMTLSAIRKRCGRTGSVTHRGCMHWLILLTALRLAFTSGGQSSPDACRAQIPQTLARALLQRFPSYRLPLLNDSLAEDIQFNRTQGGNGCILVSRADFNGDGHDDIAVALAPKAGRDPLVAVAFAQFDGWQLSTIQGWTDDIKRQYVNSAPPGVHTRSEALDGRLRHMSGALYDVPRRL